MHSHTGKLPDYKGSTTVYYSLLKEGKIWWHFFLNEKLIKADWFIANHISNTKNIYTIESEYDSKN